MLHQARRTRVESDDRRGPSSVCSSRPRVALARAGRRALGGARRAAPLHALEGDGVGRDGPSGESGREFGRDGDVDRWRAVRDEIHAEVLLRGYDDEARLVRAVVWIHPRRCEPAHGSARRIPPAGRSARSWDAGSGPARAPRRRSSALPPRPGRAGRRRAPAGEGAFFLCTFWFVDNLVLLGELEEACEMFDRLLSLAERARPPLGGVRPGARAARRQLPAGVLAHRPRQHCVAPRARTRQSQRVMSRGTKARRSAGPAEVDDRVLLRELHAHGRPRGGEELHAVARRVQPLLHCPRGSLQGRA